MVSKIRAWKQNNLNFLPSSHVTETGKLVIHQHSKLSNISSTLRSSISSLPIVNNPQRPFEDVQKVCSKISFTSQRVKKAGK